VQISKVVTHGVPIKGGEFFCMAYKSQVEIEVQQR